MKIAKGTVNSRSNNNNTSDNKQQPQHYTNSIRGHSSFTTMPYMMIGTARMASQSPGCSRWHSGSIEQPHCYLHSIYSVFWKNHFHIQPPNTSFTYGKNMRTTYLPQVTSWLRAPGTRCWKKHSSTLVRHRQVRHPGLCHHVRQRNFVKMFRLTVSPSIFGKSRTSHPFRDNSC